MITFDQGNLRFNYKAVGIILNGDRILLQTTETDDFWVLPGGRCELMESTPETIRREMREELGAEVQVERLVWVAENFFEYDDKRYHELVFIFLITLPTGSPLCDKNEPFIGDEEDVKLIFQWHKLDELERLPLYPSFLRQSLKSLPNNIEHIVHIDGKDE